ncbi:MAG: ABC transporter ATP-binding protein, partial [Actinomycetota bacterium]
MPEAIRVEGVSKVFRMQADAVSSLKERVIRLGRSTSHDFVALERLDLVVPTGETLGVMGHNGSGKSTLLKCMAGILTPTTGRVRARGRIASLLELGAGFHPELTGRENVFINAAFLGIRRREIERRFDDIVEFAELERFIDEPVKHYSSGM